MLQTFVHTVAALLLCVSIQSANCETFFITRRPNDPSCPGRLTGDPCLSLRQFISNVHRIYTSHTTRNPNTTILEIQPGYYSLSDSFTVEHIDTFILRGNATIDCNARQIQRIRNIRSVQISGLTFSSCGMDVFVENVDQLLVEYSSFRQRLRMDNVKVAEIRSTSFIGGTQMLFVGDTSVTIQQCIFEDNAMGLLAEHSNVTINESVFRRNSIPSRYTMTPVFFNVYHGAAIFMRQRFRNRGSMTLTISNTEFHDNSVVRNPARGGAIYLTDGNIVISNSTFVNNSATSLGGAIYASNDILNDNTVEAFITQSSFNNNRADTSGGAIAVSDSIQINRCFFVNNTAKRGGGATLVIRDNSSISVSDSTFNSNSASFCGVFQINGASHNVKLTNSTFAQNRARGDSDIELFLSGRGEKDDIAGVMCVRNASISVIKSDFSQNSATGYGGVFYVDDSIVNIHGSTFDNNSAGVGGGVTYTEFYLVQFRISHSLFTNNQAGGKGGVLNVRRSGSYVGAERSTFGNNTAREEGGVFVILGGSLEAKQTNFYGNEAKSGGIITACHSEVAVSDHLLVTVDDMYPVCTHYDGEIDGFNTSEPDNVATTSPTPTDITTSIPYSSTATTISIRTTTVSTDTGATSTTPSPIPTLPDTTTSPLSVYFVLKGSVYFNNSAISAGEIGEEEDALICRTNNRGCCATPPNRAGEFYYPKGDPVPIRSRAQDFYRNRGEREIRLNRIAGSTAVLGRFSCAIPDANGIVQVVYLYLL